VIRHSVERAAASTNAADAAAAPRTAFDANAVAGMHDSHPNRQAIAYAYALREAKAGWTPELRKAFFGWFPRTAPWQSIVANGPGC
jgi:hypothetical protein